MSYICKMKRVPYIYDVETYGNFFCCTFLALNNEDRKTYIIDDEKSEANELIEFVKEKYLLGYNNKTFDNLVINYIFEYPKATAEELFTFASDIINTQNSDDQRAFFTKFKRFLANPNYSYIDLMRMLFSKKLRVGLKELECSLNFENVEELPYKVGSTLNSTQKEKVIEYNINDCRATKKVALNSLKDIKLRAWTKKNFNVDVFSLDGVNLGVKILEQKLYERIGNKDFLNQKTIRKTINLKDIIYPFIKFETKEFQAVLNKYNSTTIKKYFDVKKGKERWSKFTHEPVIGGYLFKYGLGGLHFGTKCKAWHSTDTHDVLSVDVASYYPKQVEEYPEYCKPEHLPDEFIDVYVEVKNERIKAKEEGDDIKNETYKLSINGAFGNMANEHSWLHDVKALLAITVNGQLMLSMLCEKLMLNNIELIDVNTDGIYVNLRKDQKETYNEILTWWQDLTRMPLEETKFESMYFVTTADYFGTYYKKKKLDVKEKGAFITKVKVGKGMEFPIIYESIKKHMLEGKDFASVIREETDILKFCSYKRLQKKYECFWKREPQQRINRYYASRSGAHLYRRKRVDSKEKYQTEHILKESPVMLLNKLDEKDISLRDINYPFYLSKAREIIDNLDPKKGQTTLF